MKYAQIVKGRFLSRPNRFIARVELEEDALEAGETGEGP